MSNDAKDLVICLLIGIAGAMFLWNTFTNIAQTEWIKSVSDDNDRHYKELQKIVEVNNLKTEYEIKWTVNNCNETVLVIDMKGKSWYECIDWDIPKHEELIWSDPID